MSPCAYFDSATFFEAQDRLLHGIVSHCHWRLYCKCKALYLYASVWVMRTSTQHQHVKVLFIITQYTYWRREECRRKRRHHSWCLILQRLMSSSTVLSRSSDRIEHKSSSWDLCSSCSKILARYINSSWSNGWEAAYGWTAAPLVLVLALVVEASYLYLSIAPACSVLVLAAWLIVSSLLYLCTDGGNKEVESWNKYGKSEPWPWAGACANGNCETAADDADAAAAMPT